MMVELNNLASSYTLCLYMTCTSKIAISVVLLSRHSF